MPYGVVMGREHKGGGCWEVQGMWGTGRAVCLSVPQESCWTQIQSAAAHKALLLGQIRLAVLSLFQLATKHLRVPRDVALEDTETQLDVVSAGTRGHPSPWRAVASGPPSLQVLLCLQDLAAVCAELRPKEPGLGPPRVPAPTTTTRPRHHRAVVGPPSHQ